MKPAAIGEEQAVKSVRAENHSNRSVFSTNCQVEFCLVCIALTAYRESGSMIRFAQQTNALVPSWRTKISNCERLTVS